MIGTRIERETEIGTETGSATERGIGTETETGIGGKGTAIDRGREIAATDTGRTEIIAHLPEKTVETLAMRATLHDTEYDVRFIVIT